MLRLGEERPNFPGSFPQTTRPKPLKRKEVENSFLYDPRIESQKGMALWLGLRRTGVPRLIGFAIVFFRRCGRFKLCVRAGDQEPFQWAISGPVGVCYFSPKPDFIKMTQSYYKQVLGSLRLRHQFQGKEKGEGGRKTTKMLHPVELRCNPQHVEAFPCYLMEYS